MYPDNAELKMGNEGPCFWTFQWNSTIENLKVVGESIEGYFIEDMPFPKWLATYHL